MTQHTDMESMMAGSHILHASGHRSVSASFSPSAPTSKSRRGPHAMQGMFYGVVLSSVLWLLIALLVISLV